MKTGNRFFGKHKLDSLARCAGQSPAPTARCADTKCSSLSPLASPLSPLLSPLSPLLSPLLLLLLLTAGCGPPIDTLYGQRQGLGAAKSVNGTAVLGEMFEKAGHRVFSWGALSPRLQEKADCIVWFPDDFWRPSDEVCEWLDNWLKAKPGRTLIYVGRDFDAAPWYWKHVLPDAPEDQRELVQEERSFAESLFSNRREKLSKSAKCRWFTIERTLPLRHVKKLEGDAAWLDGVERREDRHRTPLPDYAERCRRALAVGRRCADQPPSL